MRLLNIFAALSGALALIMLVMVAHVLALSPENAERMQLGAFIQLAAAAAGLAIVNRAGRLNLIAGVLTLAGAAIFSGTLYALAITESRAFVMLALPMAVLGGVLGLRALGLFAPQSLDLLSMIGFVMLLGMVINNAILLIAQTRTGQDEGLDISSAVEQALNQRLRPILIGALTGVVGALPLAISPGPGAVIYRGLAAVTVGGVGLSLIFTLVLMPALLRLRLRPDAATKTSPARITTRPELVVPAKAGNQ